MDRRNEAIQRRLEWFAQRQGKAVSQVLSLKFRPLKKPSPNPTGYMYPGEYGFALTALPDAVNLSELNTGLQFGDGWPIGEKPVKIIPSYQNAIWLQHETGLELLLSFEFIESVKKVYDLGKSFVEVTGNPTLLVDLLGLAVGINSGKVSATKAGNQPLKNDRYEGHRDVQEIVVERRCFRADGTLSEIIIVKVPLGAELSDAEHAALLARVLSS